MTITIIGMGYVGLTTAAILTNAGFTVYALEINPRRLDTIRNGRSFFYEKGLDAVIKAGLESGRLIPTNSYADSVPHSSVIMSSVGTPDNPDGSSNLSYVFDSAREAAAYAQPNAIYVQKSTVPVGTGSEITQLFTSLGKQLRYVSNPEFLREGTALYDTLYFDRIVAGGTNEDAVNEVLDIYRKIEKHRDTIAYIADVQKSERTGAYIATSLASAELIKVTANAFLALKISFANSIAKLADAVNADVVEVMDAVGADERIGRRFLDAGRGYGGGCFPKDVSGLIASGLDQGIELEIMTAAQRVNDSMPGYIIEQLKEQLPEGLKGKSVAVLGLAFKANTSDVRRSPGVALANILHKNGASVTAYDPKASEEAASDLRRGVTQSPSIEAAIQGVDAVIIATDWQEILSFPTDQYAKYMRGTAFVDAVNRFNREAITGERLDYIGVGRGRPMTDDIL